MLRNIFRFCTQLSERQYMVLAKAKLNDLEHKLQQYEDDGVDYNLSQNILKITCKSITVVINTQTPNRQLWYSSTLSGPQRFNYKQGNSWTNSNNVLLDDVLFKDLNKIKTQK